MNLLETKYGFAYVYPEESLEGIMRALNHTGIDVPGFESDPSRQLMKDGQVILMTDASSQQQYLKSAVISKANELNTCINSFIARQPSGVYDDPVADGTYEEISNKTSGVFVDPSHYSDFELGKFAASNANKKCRNKDSVETISGVRQPNGIYCGTIKVSALTSLLKLAIESTSAVTITDPNYNFYPESPIGGLATFSQGKLNFNVHHVHKSSLEYLPYFV